MGVTTRILGGQVVLLGLAVSVFAAGSMTALASGFDLVPNITIAVDASNAVGHGRVVVGGNAGEWDPNTATFSWLLDQPIDILDENTLEPIGTLLSAQVVTHLENDFRIEVNLGIVSHESTTVFNIASPLVSTGGTETDFSVGRCYASITLTDLGGDGASLVGYGEYGIGAFQAFYDGYQESGTRFSHLLGTIETDNGGTATGSQAYPQFGFAPIGTDVYDMSTRLAFTITPHDLVYATTRFEISMLDPCYGDINQDWRVDISDLAVLLGAYDTSVNDPGFNPAADLNEDGIVDVSDVSELLSVYGTPCY